MTDPALPTKILVIDSDPAVGQGTEAMLKKHGVSVQKAKDLQSGLYLFNTQRFEVALIELEFPELPGLAVIQKWRKHENSDKRVVGCILMSGMKRTAALENLMREMGDVEVIQKPFNAIQVLPFLARAAQARAKAIALEEMKGNVLNYAVAKGDFASAIATVQKNLGNLGQRGVEMLFELYEKAGKFDEALTLVSGMLEKSPGNIALMNAKGRMLLKLGRLEEARTVMEKADQLAPGQLERIAEMADMYLSMKKPTESVAKMRELVKLNPENPDMKFDMFSKLMEHGYDGHAVDFCRETTKPIEVVRHYNNKGVMHSKSGETDRAITAYQHALQFFPDFKENYRILFNLALAHNNKGTPEARAEAVEHLRRCLLLEPDFEKAQKALATLTK